MHAAVIGRAAKLKYAEDGRTAATRVPAPQFSSYTDDLRVIKASS